MVIDFNKHKDLKQVTKISQDLEQVVKDLQICMDTLYTHKEYVTVMEALSVLSTIQKITEIDVAKCKKFIESQND